MIRTCVILAADGGDSAQVVLGLTLATRVALTLAQCGIDEIYVVDATLYEQLSTDSAMSRSAATVSVGSVEEIATRCSDRVLIARADHVYSSALIQLATAQESLSSEPSSEVAQAGSGVVRYGGLLVVDGECMSSLMAHDGSTLTDNEIRDADIGERFWHHIDSTDARRAAERALLRSLIKPQDGPIAKGFHRRLSLPLTRYLVKTSITPNQITIFATILGVIGAWSIFQATWQSLAIGGVLILLQSLFDHNDGEIARLTFQGSEFGRWLDHLADDALSTVYPLAFGWSAAELLGQSLYWYLGITAAAAITVFHVMHYGTLAFINKSGDPFQFRWWFQGDDVYIKNSLSKGNVLSRLVEGFHACGRRDVYVFAFTIFALVRIPQAAVIWYFIVSVVHAVLTILHVALGGMRKRPAL